VIVPIVGAIAPQPQRTLVDFDSLFDENFDYLSRTLRLLGVRESDLDDVVHDVFLHVYRHLSDYDPSRPLKPWLYCFAYRIARDYRNCARNRRTVICDEIPYADDAPGPEVVAINQQLRTMALGALESLPLEERDVFVSMVLDELSAPETAELLGVPLNTVYSRLRRARTRFDSQVERLGTKVRAQ
jgi:RNA polymerase sigma-70 factor (ECF subfamily)